MKRYRYVLAGASAAGLAAVQGIRETDPAGNCAVISDEQGLPYARPLLAHYVAGRIGESGLLYRDGSWLEEHGADLIPDRVEAVDFAGRYLFLASGEEVRFEHLLLATGGKPILPPLEGREGEGVYPCTTLSDAAGIRAHVARAGRAVVIGGGLIGVEAAEALRERGLKVAVVELQDRLLGQTLDREGSTLVAAQLQERGITVWTGVAAREIVRTGGVPKKVVLADGRELQADLVILAVGVTPRTDLARGHLETGRGVVVDACMRTSARGVFAAGDVAEAPDMLGEGRRPLLLWGNACRQGYVAGCNMAGRSVTFEGNLPLNSASICGLPVMSAGVFDPEEGEDGYEVLRDWRPAQRYYRKLVLREGAVAGVVCMGDAVDGAGVVVGLMKRKVCVAAFRDRLFQRFDLMAVPPAWRGSARPAAG